jgi:hypothetical protein
MAQLRCTPSKITCSSRDTIVGTKAVEKNKTSSALPKFLKSLRGPLKKLSSRNQSDSTTSTVALDASDGLLPVYVTIKKSVSFAPSASARYTLSREEYTPAEKRAAWYCSEEYDKITRECCKQIHRIERGDILKDVKYCARGLESLTRSAAQLKKQNCLAAYAAVLGGQVLDFLGDDEQISQGYNSVSSSCQLWASAIGLRDQIASEDYLFDVDDC